MRCDWSYSGDLAERRKEGELKAASIGKMQGRCLEANGGEEKVWVRQGLFYFTFPVSFSLCPETKGSRHTCDRVLSLDHQGKIPRLKTH